MTTGISAAVPPDSHAGSPPQKNKGIKPAADATPLHPTYHEGAPKVALPQHPGLGSNPVAAKQGLGSKGTKLSAKVDSGAGHHDMAPYSVKGKKIVPPTEGANELLKLGILKGLERATGAGAQTKEQLAKLKRDYGATLEQMTTFEAEFEAALVVSASAGVDLTRLNDCHGVLEIAGRLPNNLTLSERFKVLKVMVPSQQQGEGAQPRYFVKGYGGRIVKMDDLLQLAKEGYVPRRERNEPIDSKAGGLLARWRGQQPLSDPESGSAGAQTLSTGHADTQAPDYRVTLERGEMETPLRSRMHALSRDSELFARRSKNESPDDALMQRPLNPDVLQSTAQWWANAETALLPAAGPLQAGDDAEGDDVEDDDVEGNGARAIQLDMYKLEAQLSVFINVYEHRWDEASQTDKPIPARQRPPALRSTLPEGSSRPSAVTLGGPKVGEIRNIAHWEVVGPPTRTSVRAAKFGRGVDGLKRLYRETMRKPARDEGPTVVNITTDSGAQLQLEWDAESVHLSLINPKPSLGHAASGDIVRAGKRVKADIAFFSFDGQHQGALSTSTGVADPQLIMSTGEPLLAGPLIKNNTGFMGVLTDLTHIGLRLISSQPALARGDDGTIDWLLNTAVKVAAKVGLIYGLNMVGRAVAEHMGESGLGILGKGVAETDVAKAVAFMVFTQEGITFATTQIGKMIPTHWQSPGNSWVKLVVDSGVPAAEEAVRLTMNVLLQRSVGIDRGNVPDITALAVSSVIKGAIEWGKSRSGAAANHPTAHTGLTLLYGALYNVARGISNGYHSDVVLRAAIAARVVGRLDMASDPLLRQWLNSGGVLGENASAFDDQLAHENRLNNALSLLDNGITQLSVKLDKQIGDVAQTQAAMLVMIGVRVGLEAIKRNLNRFGVGLGPSPFDDIAGELEEARTAAEVASNPQTPEVQDRIEARLAARINELAESVARPSQGSSGAFGGASVGAQPPRERLRFSADQLAPKDRTAYLALGAEADRSWSGARPGPTEVGRHHDVRLDYGMTPRPAGAQARQFRDTRGIPPEITTWTTSGQRAALPVTRLMAAAPGIHTPRPVSETNLPPMSQAVKLRNEAMAIEYTVQSGNFHLPNRFDYTGRVEHRPILPGSRVTVPCMVMIKAGTAPGDSSGKVDMAAILDVNLAVHHAPMSPMLGGRVVHTEAPYIAPGGTTRTGEQILEGNAPNKHVTVGETVGKTELYSVGGSRLMLSYFAAGNNAGATKNRSLLIRSSLLTCVNFAAISELAQAEAVVMPGALSKILLIDADAGKAPVEKGHDLGQEVFDQQINTYTLEERFLKHAAGDLELADGEALMEPKSGHLLKAIGNPGPNDWVFDLGAGGSFRPFDPSKDRGQVLVFDDAKSYFLGRGLEDSGSLAKDGPSARARWRYPYNSDRSTRAIKEATHARILANDPMVSEGHMDISTGNPNHARFRDQGGYWETAAGKAELSANQATRDAASKVADFIDSKTLDDSLTSKEAAFFSQMLTSMLRKPTRLIVFEAGKEEGLQEFNFTRTYDGIDLEKEAAEPGVLQQQMAASTSVLFMTEDGFFTDRFFGGERELQKYGNSQGPTLRGLFHAFCSKAYPDIGNYAAPRTEGGGLVPDADAEKNVQDIYDMLRRVSRVQYLLLQEAMVRLHRSPFDTASRSSSGASSASGEKTSMGAQKSPNADFSTRTLKAAGPTEHSRQDMVAYLEDSQRGFRFVHNSGSGSNCLIISMLQHATDNYDDKVHHESAARVRTELMKAFPQCGQGEYLRFDEQDGAIGSWLVDHIEQTHGVNLGVTFVNGLDANNQPMGNIVYNPEDAPSDVKPVVIFDGGGHFEAVRGTPESIAALWNDIRAAAHQGAAQS